MPDIGWMELMVIGIVALIVVGPKDLPKMFRKMGQVTGRIRAMAREFSNAMNEAADETGMTELNRDLKAASKFTNPKKMARDLMGDALDDIDPSKFEEGSATRAVAEKKAAAQAATRAKIAEMEAARAAEESAEPEEPEAGPAPAPEDPGPANVEPGGAAGEPPAETERART